MKPSILFLFLALLTPSTLFAISLAEYREAEVSMLSVCPSKPSIAVVGGGAGVFGTSLATYGNSHGTHIVVERANLAAVNQEICFQGTSAVDPNTVVPAGNLLFAMYLVEVNFNPGAPVPVPVEITATRVDTGAVIYSENFTIDSSNADNLFELFDEHVQPLIQAVQSNSYECKNKFNTVIKEDVELACEGTVSAMNTNYTVQSNFSLTFVLEDLDFSVRGQPQTITGSTKILPSKANTNLSMNITHSGGRCSITMTTERAISINLVGTSVPSRFVVTIPQDVRNEWLFEPSLSSSPALFTGPTSMTLKSFSSGVGECQGPGGAHSNVTNYKHFEANDIRFGTHKIKPLCNQQYDIPQALTKVPNFGTPGATNITSSCPKRSAKASFGVQRKF